MYDAYAKVVKVLVYEVVVSMQTLVDPVIVAVSLQALSASCPIQLKIVEISLNLQRTYAV